MPRIGVHHQVFPGQLRYGVNVAGLRLARFQMRIMPGTGLTIEDIIGGEEDHPSANLRRRSRQVSSADGIDGKSKRRVQLAVIHAMERGGIDNPVWLLLAHDARDTNTVRDVDIRVRETDSRFAEGLHQVVTQLT